MSKTYIVYHKADPDGWCSAAIAYRACRTIECEPILVPWNYGEPIPDFGDLQSTDIILVDISFPMYKMIQLNHDCIAGRGAFVWIDHHVTAITDANSVGFNPAGLRVDGTAACELTWKFLKMLPLVDVPPMARAIEIIGAYDTWNHGLVGTWALNATLRGDMRYADPKSEAWDDLFTPTGCVEALKIGAVLWKAECTRNAAVATATVQDWGTFVVANMPIAGSESLNASMRPGVIGAFLWYVKSSGGVKVSVRSFDTALFNAAEYAKEFGGGGHAGAAGFEISSLKEAIGRLLWLTIRT